MAAEQGVQERFDTIDPAAFSISATHVEGEGWTTQDAGSIAKVTYRQIDYWARTKLVVPSITQAKGSGSRRLYSFQDIVLLRTVKRLLDGGISLQNIRMAIDSLRRYHPDDLAAITVVSDGVSVYEVTSAEEVIDHLQGGQCMFGIALKPVVRDVESDIAQLPGVVPLAESEQAQTLEAGDELARRRQLKAAG